MGRKGSRLIPFLKKALLCNQYCNLRYEDVDSQTFSLNLPRKSPHLDKNCQLLLKDWYETKNRTPYRYHKDYCEAKQGMEAALKKSDFLLRMHSGQKQNLIYRILNDEEVKTKKSKKAFEKRLKKASLEGVDEVPSPQSSGYGSGSDIVSYDVADRAHTVKNDHTYAEATDSPPELEKMDCENDPPPVHKEDCLLSSNAFAPEQEININFIEGKTDVHFGCSNPLPIEVGENDWYIQEPLLSEIDYEQILNGVDLLQFEISPELNEELCQFLELVESTTDSATNDMFLQSGVSPIQRFHSSQDPVRDGCQIFPIRDANS